MSDPATDARLKIAIGAAIRILADVIATIDASAAPSCLGRPPESPPPPSLPPPAAAGTEAAKPKLAGQDAAIRAFWATPPKHGDVTAFARKLGVTPAAIYWYARANNFGPRGGGAAKPKPSVHDAAVRAFWASPKTRGDLGDFADSIGKTRDWVIHRARGSLELPPRKLPPRKLPPRPADVETSADKNGSARQRPMLHRSAAAGAAASIDWARQRSAAAPAPPKRSERANTLGAGGRATKADGEARVEHMIAAAEGRGGKTSRQCLRCDKRFIAETRFLRLCPPCRASASAGIGS